MTKQPPEPRKPKVNRRPLSVTLLAWLVLMMALMGWLRLFETARLWQFLLELSPPPPAIYLALIGLFWGLVGMVLVWGLVVGCSWAPRLTKIAALLYTFYYWADRLLIATPAAIATRWPFALGLNIALLLLAFWVLSRPKARQFFNIDKPDRF